MVESVIRFDVARRVGARSLLGPDIGERAAERILAFATSGRALVLDIDLTGALLLEYSFVSTSLARVLDSDLHRTDGTVMVVTCELGVDGREIRKGLVWNSQPTMPAESDWNRVISQLGRYVVLRDGGNDRAPFEYVGTSEPELLDLLHTLEERGSLSARDLVGVGWPTAKAADLCRELVTRRQVVVSPAGGDEEPVYIAIPKFFLR